MANKNQHVVPHGKNWAVKGAGNTKATSIHKTQKGAIDAARETCKSKVKIKSDLSDISVIYTFLLHMSRLICIIS
jgi:hypothetical protein